MDKRYIKPNPVIRVNGMQVFVLINDREVPFSIHQVAQSSTDEGIVNREELIYTTS